METVADQQVERTPPASDESFLRRVSFDIIGQPPSTEAILAFSLDPDPNKRAALVEKLLADERYADNWSRYWRDVIFYRRSEDRALLAAGVATDYLREELSQNTPWDEVATAFITAKGDVREDGATALIFAQNGRPEETVAEISRIFLGVQIQCAQCHDHPYDRWKREQFHELAAFFPRVAVRPQLGGDKRTFLVTATDRRTFIRRNANNRFVGELEHFMPDLDDPGAKGTKMQPVFFATGDEVKFGTDDADRRELLAKWLTSKSNPWFARAIVNRMWAEMVGEPFYAAIDDMGPDRECSAPQTLDYLSAGFVESGHDVKWLIRTIAATETYQRQSRSRRSPGELPYQTVCNQRLRGDQLFDSLTSLLNVPEQFLGGRGRGRGQYGVQATARNQFNAAFGYDPSAPREEVAGSIQQTLFLMNSPFITNLMSSKRAAGLGRLLQQIDSDEDLVSELYLKAFSREPTAEELQNCVNYVKEVGDRDEAFEDILWVLMNSSEFAHR